MSRIFKVPPDDKPAERQCCWTGNDGSLDSCLDEQLLEPECHDLLGFLKGTKVTCHGLIPQSSELT